MPHRAVLGVTFAEAVCILLSLSAWWPSDTRMCVCVCVADQLCRQPVVKGKPVIDRFGASVDRLACAPSDGDCCALKFAKQFVVAYRVWKTDPGVFSIDYVMDKR